jgi:hypothetical protein
LVRVPRWLFRVLRLIAVERGAGSFELSSSKTAFGPWPTNFRGTNAPVKCRTNVLLT